MWAGWKPSELEELSQSDALMLWELYQRGMAGPSVDYVNGYANYQMLHGLTEVLISANSKNYKAKSPEPIDKVFSGQMEVMTLGESKKKPNADLSLSSQAALALPGAPAWLLQATQEEITEVRDG